MSIVSHEANGIDVHVIPLASSETQLCSLTHLRRSMNITQLLKHATREHVIIGLQKAHFACQVEQQGFERAPFGHETIKCVIDLV